MRAASNVPDRGSESGTNQQASSNQLAGQYNSLANQNARDLAKLTRLDTTVGDNGFPAGRAGFGGPGLASGAAYANGGVVRQQTLEKESLNPLSMVNTQQKRPSKEETV